MIISKNRKFIFIHIYKNAGTSITNALIPFATSQWERRADRILKKFGILHLSSQPYPGHISASNLLNKMGKDVFKSFFSFAIVRNPWAWQVSLYTYALKDTSHFQHKFIKNLGSFDEYLRWRVANEVKLQKDFIYSKDGELLIDFVGKFETIDADFQKICSRLGISASLPKLNVSNTKPYQQYYNKETKELVKKAFEADISLFGYKFE